MKMFRNMNKVAKFFVATLFLCGAITLIDASFNPVHAIGKSRTK